VPPEIFGPFTFDIDQHIHVAKFGINYRFGGFGGPVVARYYPTAIPVGPGWIRGFLGDEPGDHSFILAATQMQSTLYVCASQPLCKDWSSNEARPTPCKGSVSMYFVLIPLLTVILPVGSIVAELMSAPASDIVWLIGKWFTFWGIGVRLLAAGLMQIFNPSQTLGILSIANRQASIVVQELGFANLGLGLIGIISLFLPAWLMPAALAGGLFLFLAGARHVMKPNRNGQENMAMITDLIVAAAALLFVVRQTI
jgi:hypothetical protein